MTRVDGLGLFIEHVLSTSVDSIPASALMASRRFLLDSIGVGVNGSAGPYVAELLAMYLAQEGNGPAGVFGSSTRLSAPSAAFMNAYQIHNSEYDCVHEAAVVHPMAVLLGALSAEISSAHGQGVTVTGSQFEAALTVGVDIATGLGIASRAPLSFFRPGTAGAFGATLAIARLRGFDAVTARNAVGILLGQLSGTMQAHIEGSPLLAMQVGFNARNALLSCNMASAGIPGPQDALQGQFGFYALFEGEYDLTSVLAQLTHVWRMEEVAHKPFPSGRATHGIVDACLDLRKKHGFNASAVASVSAFVPPLTQRLIGRPVGTSMNINYARLCAPFVAAIALRYGDVQPEHFSPLHLADADTHELATRIDVVVDGNSDLNALTPIRVVVNLRNGTRFEQTLDVIYGNPAKPMLRADYIRKFERNLGRSAQPLPECEARARELIKNVEQLDSVADINDVLELACV